MQFHNQEHTVSACIAVRLEEPIHNDEYFGDILMAKLYENTSLTKTNIAVRLLALRRKYEANQVNTKRGLSYV